MEGFIGEHPVNSSAARNGFSLDQIHLFTQTYSLLGKLSWQIQVPSSRASFHNITSEDPWELDLLSGWLAAARGAQRDSALGGWARAYEW